MATISISLNDELKKTLDELSEQDGISRSDMVQKLIKQAKWEKAWAKHSAIIRKKFEELGIETIDQAEEYLG